MAMDATGPRTRRASLGAGLGALMATVAGAVGRLAAVLAEANDPAGVGSIA